VMEVFVEVLDDLELDEEVVGMELGEEVGGGGW
jgi:hypothetical protein